ncbi:MAG: hypothetical protein ACI9VM_000548 [Candidatus Azotimanducaceae bacterium]|jgi:hypothetical protein
MSTTPQIVRPDGSPARQAVPESDQLGVLDWEKSVQEVLEILTQLMNDPRACTDPSKTAAMIQK